MIMKDYISAKERMNNLIINKNKKWKWLGTKYGARNKKERSSNDQLNEIQCEKISEELGKTNHE